MKDTQKAAFSFDKYQVSRFSFKEPEKASDVNVTIGFSPSGIYDEENGIFILTVKFIASSQDYDEQQVEVEIDEVNKILSVEFEAYFRFEGKVSFEEIPTYFYRNSIAIVFPYLRAFITTLTLQANVKPLVLPIMNLSNLEQPLRENSKILE